MAGAALYIVLWVFPVSFDFLNARISQKVESLTGLRFSAKETSFYVSRGLIVFNQPVLHNPKIPDSAPIKCGRIEIDFDWSDVLFSSTKTIDRVLIRHIDDIKLTYEHRDDRRELVVNDSVNLSDITKQLEYKDLEKGELSDVKYIIRQFRVDDINLKFTAVPDEAEDSDLPTASPRILTFESVEFDYSFLGKENEETLEIRGMVGVGELTRFSGSFRLSSNRSTINYELALQEFSNSTPFDLPFPFAVKGNGLKSSGKVSLGLKNVDFDTLISFKEFTIRSSADNTILPNSRPEFSLKGKYILAERRIVAANGRFSILGSDVVANNLQIALVSPFAYKCSFEFSDLSDTMANLIKTHFAYGGVIADVKENAIQLSLRSEGSFEKINDAAISGEVRFEDISFQPDFLDEPVHSISGAVSFSRESIAVSGLHVVHGKNDVTISGEISGDLFSRSPDCFRLEWDGKIDLEELVEIGNQVVFAHDGRRALLLGDSMDKLKEISVSGIIIANGKFSAALDDDRRLKDVTTSQTLVLENCEISHPLLPSPIIGISAKIRIDNNEIELDECQAEFAGVSCSLRGTSRGELVFWESPEVDLSLSASGEIEEVANTIVALVPEEKRTKYIEEFRAKGDVDINVGVKGNPFDYRSLRLTASCIVDNGTFECGKPWTNVPFENVSLEATVGSKGIFFPKFRTLVRQTTVEGRGEISTEKASMTYTANGLLEDARALLAVLFYHFDMSGGVRSEFTFTATPKYPLEMQLLYDENAPEDEITIGNLQKLIKHYITRLKNPKEEFDLTYDGEVEVDDATCRHPGIPIDITHINGKFTIDEKVIKTEGAKAQLGSVMDCTVSGETKYRGPKRNASLKIATPNTAVFDEWISGWGKYDRDEKYTAFGLPPRQRIKPVVDIELSLEAGKMKLKKLNCDQTSFDLKLISDQSRGVKTLKCDNIEIAMYGGKMEGVANFDFIDKPSTFSTSITFEQIDISRFIKDYRVKKQPKEKAHGLASGFATIKGRGVLYETYTGRGEIRILDSSFFENRLFKELGRVVRLGIFDDISFTDVHATFDIQEGYIRSDDVLLANPIVDIRAKGQADFSKNLDFDVRMHFVGAIIPNAVEIVPFLGEVVSTVDNITSKFLQVHLGGNLDDQEYKWRPLSRKKRKEPPPKDDDTPLKD